jgi:hypothetical protein
MDAIKQATDIIWRLAHKTGWCHRVFVGERMVGYVCKIEIEDSPSLFYFLKMNWDFHPVTEINRICKY